MDQISVLKCHPWIGMLTHTVLEGFITEVNFMFSNSNMWTSKIGIVKAINATFIEIKYEKHYSK